MRSQMIIETTVILGSWFDSLALV